jgi:hypothetical protein
MIRGDRSDTQKVYQGGLERIYKIPQDIMFLKLDENTMMIVYGTLHDAKIRFTPFLSLFSSVVCCFVKAGYIRSAAFTIQTGVLRCTSLSTVYMQCSRSISASLILSLSRRNMMSSPS